MIDYDAIAKEVLAGSHCRYCDRDYKCPDDDRDTIAAVAQRMRELVAEMDERIADLRKLWATCSKELETQSIANLDLNAELAALKHDIARYIEIAAIEVTESSQLRGEVERMKGKNG